MEVMERCIGVNAVPVVSSLRLKFLTTRKLITRDGASSGIKECRMRYYCGSLLALEAVYFDKKTCLWYLVMEYNESYVDLFIYIDCHGPQSDEVAASIVRQLVDVTYYPISNNIDHRDIKDDNILFNPETNDIKLIDLSSSRK